MANKILKGLTVEIGGDTTKLGKALDDVNKKGKDVSTELGQINKLLKMDPKNTDLLTQKQKVLADAVANTASKLDTLKEAEKQVQKQFAKGDASEEQLRALQREIISTEKELQGYEKALKGTTYQLKHHGKTADEAKESTQKFGDTVKKVGSVAAAGFGAVTAAVGAAAGALIATAESSREYRREMGKLDTAFTTSGHSSEAAKTTYQALQGVLGETDQAVEAANHLAQLTDNEADLAKWTDICTGVYATFGASLPIEGLTEAANETAKVGKVTGPLADALNWAGVSEDAFNESLAACSDEQERQTLIMETLSGLYDEAATKYQETNAEVIRANEANEAWAASMAEIGAEVEPLLSDVKLLGASLISDLLPGIKDITGAFGDMLSGGETAADDLGEAVGGMFADLLTKATELLPKLVTAATSIVTSVGTSIIRQLPTLIPQIVRAVVSSAPQILDAGLTLFRELVKAIPLIASELYKAMPQIWNTIWGYLKTLPGKLLSIGGDLIKGLWQGITDKDGWLRNKIKGWVGNVTSFLKKLFGINSPSKVTAYMGEMLDEGLAVGIDDNADAPKKAMSDVSSGLLNEVGKVDGVAIECQISHSYSVQAAESAAQNAGALSKLEQIYQAILKGQVIMLDGKTLVGSTADRYDNVLGQRRVLAERGAI
jgi:phage-related minor tail protein